ncbi:hypothetical protein B0O99DRAFT_589490 [Bisporella sp. PMI_857]|nr:hypothetical protein B0O99DRAFT_589490 [Bisporella sp. PMI_857]
MAELKKDNAIPTRTRPNHSLFIKLVTFLVHIVGNLIIMSISAFVIHRYDPSAASTPPTSAVPIKFTVFSHSRTLSVPSLLAHPTTFNFIAACVLFSLGLSSFPPPGRDDPYQPIILGTSVIGAHLEVQRSGYGDRGYWMAMKSCVPASMVGCLVFSLVIHKLTRASQTPAKAPALVKKEK